MATIGRLTGVSGNVAVKAPCRAATTANITLSGLQTIDGVTLVAGDRILVKNQGAATQNGIYNASAGAWSRAIDYDGSNDVVKGTLIPINEGATYSGGMFRTVADEPVIFGSSLITFAAITAVSATAAATAAAASAAQADISATASAASATAAAASETRADASATAAAASATAAAAAIGLPAGTVIHVAMSTAPTGFLKCNGAAVSRTTYASLFTAIGTAYGAGNGTTTFNVPDLRGEFTRSLDDGRGVDSGRVLGSAQSEMVGGHNHTASTTVSGSTDAAGSHTHTVPNGSGTGGSGLYPGFGNYDSIVTPVTTSASGTHSHTISVTAATTVATSSGTENRPRNIALLACIKT